MSDIDAFYEARGHMVRALKEELIGSAADAVLTETPMNRFVAGILYPQERPHTRLAVDDLANAPENARQNPDTDDEGVDQFEAVDTPVSLSHVRYPSAFGLSFSVAESSAAVTAIVSAARYEDKAGQWHRRAVGPVTTYVDLNLPGSHDPIEISPTLELHVVVRTARDGAKPVTLALVNTATAPAQGLRDGSAWYQVELTVTCPNGFLDRPTHTSTGLEDADVASSRLLFRDARNVAVGHGCAVEWDDDEVVTELRMSFVPSHDVPRADTTVAGVPPLPMSALAADGGFALLETLIERYREWISDQRLGIIDLNNPALVATAEEHLVAAEAAAGRMEAGLTYLRTESDALRAFTLMNRAMLDQRNKQEAIRNGTAPGEQYWRPFQIAFVLMNLRGLGDPSSDERDLADLLWFPTGGGKTEAYLGLIGFTILLRRIRNPQHAGVSVLMRYTLRLLTLQQFERAAGLICALEQIRQTDLPQSVPISLGLWVGQAATPNDHRSARTALNKLKKGEPVNENNPLQLTRCPWCGTTLTHADYLIQQYPTERMTIRCPNASCDYHGGIPAYVIDNDVYAQRPSLVIGTVDKFAMMAWRQAAQSLFSSDGKDPKPDLIVQDELHLISGPLGTMVGLYETAVDAACTSDGHRPKLIASTATIRRASSQMWSVFAREARQFPPQGLDAGDSFFSKDADPTSTGTRQYVGVLAQGVTHTYLMVRTYAALLQAAAELEATDDVRDAFWTLMGYFNSLRVLGGAAMQATDDVPAQMQVIAGRHSTEPRELGEPKELTSRIPSSEVPERLLDLGRATGGSDPALDVVLATNMISVGLDVDRLGLMAVMGQPQATAEYIQATSRVGRRNPGLVVVIFNANRSRDLSHYEAFSSFHRALYRQVEPNSATPFSPRARDRGLHGTLVAYARNNDPGLASDDAAALLGKDHGALDPVVSDIVKRAAQVSPDEAGPTKAQLDELVAAWIKAAGGDSLKYPGWRGGGGALLVDVATTLRDTEQPPAFPVTDAPWATLTSLRDVDAVSGFYLIRDGRTKMSKTVGESRRSQLVGTFGVGSMFPAPEQSLMICGIDHWYEDRCAEISEPRLSKSLGVSTLRSPSAGRSNGDIPVIRFPRQYFCPECRRLDEWRYFDTNHKSPRCPSDGHIAVPSRFVTACKFGHIDDFPYYQWAHSQGERAAAGVKHALRLVTKGETSSLSDIVVTCSCGASRSLDGSFAPRALVGVSWCAGERPWLPGTPREACKEYPRTLQRGSSSVWYGNLRSAISIPPWSEVHAKIRGSWSLLEGLDDATLTAMFTQGKWIPEGSHWTVPQLVQIVQDIRNNEPLDEAKLRQQEYDAIRLGHPETNPADQFVCDPVPLVSDSPLTPFVDEIRQVSRLREVTALVSFSRLVPTDESGATAAKLSADPVGWLPAVEVFGEGIFVKLNEARLAAWASSSFARQRTALVAGAASGSFFGSSVSTRYLLVHSFAHALMDELSMDAGYPVASLRERIYADDGQAGVLIYTATADSAGSLGGLCAQSEPGRLTAVIRSAMQRALWCTSDPVCIESQGSGIDNLNLAACHACLLVPETSCEHRNTMLDRALLVGRPDQPDAGFFSEFLQT